MWAASELADWWDAQHRQAKQELDRFVENNPNLFGVLVATAVATAMEVGAGTVDSLRFGEGLAQGGVAGIGKDALRLIALAGPLGKGAKLVQTTANARLARLLVDRGGGICGWISSAQALRHTGTRAFVTLEDLAKALGKSVNEFGGSTLLERIAVLKQLGARISNMRIVSSLEEVAQMTRNDGSVTLFSVVGKRLVRGVSSDVGHAVYAFRDSLGRLRIMDRGGSAGKAGEVFQSLKELATKYKIEGEWTVRSAAVLENVFAKFMGAVSSAPVFALDAYVMAGVNHAENEAVAQAFEIHKTVTRSGKASLEKRNCKYHTVVNGDWLSKLARSYYGDMYKWPVIYEANRDVIGRDPNLIRQGQRLLIPELPSVMGIK